MTDSDKVSIEFSVTELEYITAAVDYIFEHYHHEGKDIEDWGDPKILDNVRTKAEKALKEFD